MVPTAKSILLLTIGLTLWASCLPCYTYGITAQDEGFPINPAHTATPSDSLVTKTFIYNAPGIAEAFLVWNSASHNSTLFSMLNPGTRFDKDHNFTPLEKKGDSLFGSLILPQGTTLSYLFWSTKNTRGHYLDFWDGRSSGTIQLTDESTILHKGTAPTSTPGNKMRILNLGWVFLIILCGCYLIIHWFFVRRNKPVQKFSFALMATCMTLSVIAFHLLARAMIINVSPRALISNPDVYPKIFRAGFEDITLVLALGLIVVITLLAIHKSSGRKWIFGGYIMLGLVLSIGALCNILIVNILGRPLNYQWLYYSDFLGSDDAFSAIEANLGWRLTLNLLAFGFATWLLGLLLYRIAMLPIISKHWKVFSSLVFLFLALGGISAYSTTPTWSTGQSENMWLSFARSWISSDDKPVLITLNLPARYRTTRQAVPVGDLQDIAIEPGAIKNVVFIVLESAGAAYFDNYGGNFNITPRLNALESQALKLTNCYAHAPGTNRSMVSMLCSIYPNISYKSITQEYPDLQQPSISSILKSQGRRTSFFSTSDLSFQNSRLFLSHREFDTIMDYEQIPCSINYQLSGSTYQESGGVDDLCLSDLFTTWIDQDPSKSFFSVLWTVQGHYPYYFSMKERDYGVSNISFNRYLNILNHYDHLVGSIVDELGKRELLDSTLIIVTGDHGEAFGQHGQTGHGSGIYEENIRVPLLFINPRLFQNAKVDFPVGLKDIPSTVLSILGVPLPPEWQGIDMMNYKQEEVYFFAPWSDHLFGYRQGNMKYLFNESNQQVEVFNLGADPQELQDLSKQLAAENIQGARYRLASWIQFQDSIMQERVNRSYFSKAPLKSQIP